MRYPHISLLDRSEPHGSRGSGHWRRPDRSRGRQVLSHGLQSYSEYPSLSEGGKSSLYVTRAYELSS